MGDSRVRALIVGLTVCTAAQGWTWEDSRLFFPKELGSGRLQTPVCQRSRVGPPPRPYWLEPPLPVNPIRYLLRTMPGLSAKAGPSPLEDWTLKAAQPQLLAVRAGWRRCPSLRTCPTQPGLLTSLQRRKTKFLGQSSKPRKRLGIGVPRLEGNQRGSPIQLHPLHKVLGVVLH